jgi:hypothetical protein
LSMEEPNSVYRNKADTDHHLNRNSQYQKAKKISTSSFCKYFAKLYKRISSLD